MKNSIRTAISAFIFMMCLTLCGGLNAKGLSGVWKYKTSGNSSTVSYKVFTKDSRYMNIRSTNNGKTFFMKQQGLFEIVTPGLYIEHLGATHEHKSGCADYMMSYKMEKGKLFISFQLGNDIYNEVWEKVDGIKVNFDAPGYEVFSLVTEAGRP